MTLILLFTVTRTSITNLAFADGLTQEQHQLPWVVAVKFADKDESFSCDYGNATNKT